jgi:threonyl-tRNA synthetase
MLHRAIVGSLERFIGILIEHYAAPAVVAGAGAGVGAEYLRRQADYVQEVATKLQSGLRVQADLRNEKITYKIREHSVKNCLTSGGGRQRTGCQYRGRAGAGQCRSGRCPSMP